MNTPTTTPMAMVMGRKAIARTFRMLTQFAATKDMTFPTAISANWTSLMAMTMGMSKKGQHIPVLFINTTNQ